MTRLIAVPITVALDAVDVPAKKGLYRIVIAPRPRQARR
jgi:hypothetical protein